MVTVLPRLLLFLHCLIKSDSLPYQYSLCSYLFRTSAFGEVPSEVWLHTLVLHVSLLSQAVGEQGHVMWTLSLQFCQSNCLANEIHVF